MQRMKAFADYLQFYRSLRRGHLVTVILLAVLVLGLILLSAHGWGEGWPRAMQERIEIDKKPTLEDYIQTSYFYSACFGAVLGFVLLVTAPVWLRPLPGTFSGAQALAPVQPTRLFWPTVLGAILVGAVLFGARMPLSIYNDEEHTLRNYVRGEFEKPPGDLLAEPVFEPRGWDETFFSVSQAPNMVLFSGTARGALSIYQFFRGTDQRDFHEIPFRLPSFLAGLGLILAVGLLGRQVFSPAAGVLGAWLTAFHPWIVRYASEGRGYALAMFFIILAWNFLLPALRSGRWRWWLGYGAAQFAALYAYLGCVYVPVTQNLLILAALWFVWLRDPERRFPAWTMTLRWAMANTLAIALLLFALSPSLPQLFAYFQLEIATGSTVEHYLRDFWTFMTLGMPWFGAEPSMAAWQTPVPLLLVTALVFPALCITGCILLLRRSVWGAVLLLTGVLSPWAGYFHNVLGERLLYIWYLVWTTPFLVLFAAVAIAKCRDWTTRAAGKSFAGSLVAIGLVSLLITAQLPALAIYLGRSKQGLAPAVAAMERPVDPSGLSDNPVIPIACWVSVPHYDPHCSVIYNREIIEDAIALAEKEDRPLSAAYSMRALIEHYQPDVLELLEDRRVFTPVAKIPGLEEESYTTFVVHYLPGGIRYVDRGENGDQEEAE